MAAHVRHDTDRERINSRKRCRIKGEGKEGKGEVEKHSEKDVAKSEEHKR